MHQAAEAALALRAVDWRFAPTVSGTPSPWRTTEPVAPSLLDAGAAVPGLLFGIALLSRLPVRAWHVLGLGTSRGRLPMRAPGPGGEPRWWWVPDEPRLAVAAELDAGTVVTAHLSFWPPAAIRQLRRIRSWMHTLPAPVVLAGDLNLPGPVPARVLGGDALLRARTYPREQPRVQLDHVLAAGGPVSAVASTVHALPVGDHRAAAVTLHW